MSFTPQAKIKKIIRLPKLQLAQNKQIVKMPSVTSGGKSAIKTPITIRTQKQQEEDKLRTELHQEIELRSRPCANRNYECTLPRLQGRDYCARHILSDPTAPYKQCSYVHASSVPGGTGRRCHLPAPAVQEGHTSRRDVGLCYEHAHLAMVARQHSSCSAAPPASPATKLQKLQHYVKPERPRTISSASAVSVVSDAGDQDPGTTGAVVLDPFKQMDAATVLTSAASTVLDYRSDTDSDLEITMGPISGPAGADEDSSGPEDTPFMEDPLMSAGVYTNEEVLRCSQAALVALQSLYLGQMTRLRRKLRLKRIRYLAALRREKDTHCSIHSQVTTGEMSGSDLEQLKQLKAMISLQKKHGVESILAKKLNEKRLKAGGGNVSASISGASKCAYSEGGVKCGQPGLPLAKHCRKHIMLDPNQVLFAMCGDTRAGHLCQEPQPPYPISDARHLGDDHTPACVFHTDPPPYTVFTLRKDESDDTGESDGEDIRESSFEMGEVAEEVVIGAEQTSSENTSDNVIIDCLIPQENITDYNG